MDENVPVEVDDFDTNSGYAEDFASYSTSLASSAMEYRYEFGRRYHFHRQGRHFLPNDEQEQERMDLTHSEMMLLLGNNLHLAPIREPQRVLDLGTGTGIWAIDFADIHPEAQVIGNDLSPIQPGFVPPNLQFVVDDMEDEWAYEGNPFDYIHARYLAGSIKDWPRLMQQAYACTRPGGWVEFQDWDCMCSDELKRPTPAALGPHLERWVRDAGFVNVAVRRFVIPHSNWPKDERLKKIGALNMLQWEHGLEGITIGCLNRSLSDEPAWSIEEIQVLMAEARADARKRGLHGQYSFYVVYGQKPGATAPQEDA